MHKQTRRWSAVGLSAAAIAALLLGCTSAPATPDAACKPSDKPVTLEFWNWGTGMQDAVDLWNSENPDIQVELKEVPNGNAGTYQNLFNGLKAGTAPDIAPIEYDTVASFRLADGLYDISGCAGVAEAKADFVPWTWSQVSDGKAVYGIPQDIGPLALYYRKDLFDAAGLTAPTTWDEYYEDAKVLKEKTGAYITHFSQTDPNWFTGLLWQNGAKLFDTKSDSWVVDIASPKATEVADYWQKLIDEGLVTKDLQGFSEALNKAWDQGDVATWVSASWGWSIIRDGAPSTAGKWAVAPIPQWTEGASVDGNWGGASTAVLATSKHPYEASKFITWLNGSPESLAILIANTGIYPASIEGANDSTLTGGVDFYGGQHIFDVFKTAADQVDSSFTWGPTMTDTYRFLGDGIAGALAGTNTLGDALKSTQEQTVKSIEAQGLTVAK